MKNKIIILEKELQSKNEIISRYKSKYKNYKHIVNNNKAKKKDSEDFSLNFIANINKSSKELNNTHDLKIKTNDKYNTVFLISTALITTKKKQGNFFSQKTITETEKDSLLQSRELFNKADKYYSKLISNFICKILI